MKLSAKLFIEGKIKSLTGLAIGGSNTDMVIGGLDSTVIKTSEGIPYIPGSSLKGKLRSLIEKKKGRSKICDCGRKECEICTVFGVGAGAGNEKIGPTRLYVRDANLDETIKKQMKNKVGIFSELELNYTESKVENVINRKNSKSDNLRNLERVPAGAKFDLNLVYNILMDEDIKRFKEVVVALRMLEDDYIGGNGSRGYGRIKFEDLKIGIKTIKEYEGDNKVKNLYQGELDEINFNELRQ
ncbi:CRISPR-associated protein, Csm3 family [Candidatus Frackibacter sp. WG12]|uniref:type III-A CRISPR-associated RAMP protein Csm3 n=2 Tax=Candidatus Frackibacter TaxID=2017975 RepID=UPI0008CF8041|nr:type III-A CRISPR-associated RAMP protein Csm3 [Candidatus Frackibacter sp. WG12]SEM52800.1 CRISPR-associated protein, Csm3 family [Candidatus Frackibacter sp. WG12]